MLHSSSAQSNISRARSRISRYTASVAGDEGDMRGDYMLRALNPCSCSQLSIVMRISARWPAKKWSPGTNTSSLGSAACSTICSSASCGPNASWSPLTKSLGFEHCAEKRKRIDTALGSDGSSQRYQGADVRIGTTGAQPGGGAEGESGKDDWQPELAFQPSQRCLHVGDLAASVIVLAGAQSRPAKVEAQHRKADRVQSLHGVEDNLIVHGPAKHWVRMTDQPHVGSRGRADVQQGLQTPRRTFDEERADCRVRLRQAACFLAYSRPPSSLYHVVKRPSPLAQRVSRPDRSRHIRLGRLNGLRKLPPERQLAGYRHGEGASRPVG